LLKTVSLVVGSGKVVVYQAFLQAFDEFKLANVGVELLLLELGAEYPPPPPPPPHETTKKRTKIKNHILLFINTPRIFKKI
tara:strand:- start:318 stop:560 length:243 start_codon:yes stop_codon:yes gene_type:complete